jgi:hypothetical protein
MRETRLSGSEGGAAQSMRRSYPYLCERCHERQAFVFTP